MQDKPFSTDSADNIRSISSVCCLAGELLSYLLLWGGVAVLLCRRRSVGGGSFFGGLLLIAFFLFLAGSSQLLRHTREDDSDLPLERGLPIRGRGGEFLGRYSVILLPLACLAVLLLLLFRWRAVPLLALLFLGQWWWFFLIPSWVGGLRRWVAAEPTQPSDTVSADDVPAAAAVSGIRLAEETSGTRRREETTVPFEPSVSIPFAAESPQTLHETFFEGSVKTGEGESVGEIEEDIEQEDEPDPDCLYSENRYRTEDGLERIEGWVRPRFAPGQDLCVIHLNFTPPFESTPELELFQLAGSDVKLTATRVEPFGARIEVRRLAGDRHAGEILPGHFPDDTIRFGFIVQSTGSASDRFQRR